MFELREKKLADQIIAKLQKIDGSFRFMHVCGTHQDTLVKNGLDTLFRKCGVVISQGPGCPVCVTTPREIEEMMLLAKKGMMVASYGDMLRVPGETESLQSVKAQGASVHMVYSIEDAVEIARRNPNQEVVFMAVGFETTAPSTAAVVHANPPENFSVLCCHRLIPPGLDAIMKTGEVKLDGFIEPGHVSTIIGTTPYDFLSKSYHIPQVVAGFEPLDVLMAVWMLVQQIQRGDAVVENEYSRVVHPQGNKKAREAIDEVFHPIDVKWRGFPSIAQSGLELKASFEHFNARKKFEDLLDELQGRVFSEPAGCKCGEVLRGICSSQQCPLFGSTCTPSHPVGPCMVSSEGSCNIEYRYKQ